MATRRFRCAWVGALLVAASVDVAYTQSLVRGTILDERKQPLEGALVAFDAIDFANQREAKTDKKGQFLFQGLDSGEYKISVSKAGYETVTMTRTVSRANKLDVSLTLSSLASLRRTTRAPEMNPRVGSVASDAPALPSAAVEPAVAASAGAEPQDAGSSATRYSQGVALWNAGKYAEALVQFEASVKADSQNAQARYQLGIAHLNLGQLREARAAFEAYLKRAPDGPHAGEVKTVLQQLSKEGKP